MKRHKLNLELSIKLYEENKDEMEIKECYSNIYRVVLSNMEKFYDKDWKVAYGYYPTPIEGLYARHCFIIDSNNRAIDPTIVIQKGRNYDDVQDYFSFIVFESLQSYLSSLNTEGYFALEKTLRPFVSKVIEWSIENNITLID